MLRVTWRNLFAHKVRLFMSAFAIVLGVAFVGGSLIFTDAMGGAFDDIIEGTTSEVEIGYPGATDFDSLQDNRTIPASVVADLQDVPGVAAVHASLQLQSVYVVGTNNKVVGGSGPPGLAFNYTGAKSLVGKPILTVRDGALPQGPNEIALDAQTADKAGYDIGDTVSLVTPGTPPTLKARLTGLVEFGNGGLNGATLTIFERQFMQDRFFGGKDVYSSISLEAQPGVSQVALRDNAQSALPDSLEARTGDDVVETNKKGLDGILNGIQIFMLVFAGISLVVGAFLIVNTFSILVAQRSRELALLRALGASRLQVIRSVVLEALVVGLIGSTAGLGLGVLLAQGIRALVGRFGLDLSRADFPIQPTTVMWCYLLGVLVTLVASVLPAVRASRVAPVAALRDDVALPETALRRRVAFGSVMIGVGGFSVVMGFIGGGNRGLILIGLGLLSILIGVSLVSPLFARPVIGTFGAVYRRAFGTIGQLATQNSLRNPRRTAATSSALMIGLALMATVSIFGRSAQASTDVTIATTLKAQLIVSNVINAPFSTDVANQISKVSGVRAVSRVQQAFPKVDGEQTFVAAVDGDTFSEAIDIDLTAGSLSDLGPGTVALSDSRAAGTGKKLGDTLTMEFQAGKTQLRVAAIYATNAAVPGTYLVSPETFAKGGLAPLDAMVFVLLDPEVPAARVKAGIDAVTKDLPTVTVKDPQGYANEQKKQITIFLTLIYCLLGLSVVIAILGVVNTLGLSVIERTREVGLLRAVGMSRRQLRTMVRLEAVVIGVFGALLGVMVGIAFGVALVKALQDDGLTELSIPWELLAAFVVAAGAVGVVAAVLPGRRAARLDVLRAISTE